MASEELDSPAALHAPVLSVIGGETIVAIHSDLSISRLDPGTLALIEPPTIPLPCEVTSGTILSDRIVIAWVDRAHRIARISALPMGTWREGPSKEKLRAALNYGHIELTHPPDAIWSHELTAEPLAVTAVDGDLVFCTLDRGTYRVDPHSEEVWRAPLPEWPTVWPSAPADVIETLVPAEGVIWAFSDACGFAAISADDGEVLDIGRLPVSGALGIVRRSDRGDWLIAVDDERLLLLDEEFRMMAEIDVPRPVVDAIYPDTRL